MWMMESNGRGEAVGVKNAIISSWIDLVSYICVNCKVILTSFAEFEIVSVC